MSVAPLSVYRNSGDSLADIISPEEVRMTEFIDELIRLSDDARVEKLGPNYFDWIKQFFLFQPAFFQPQLEYQIKLKLPQLQTLMVEEASDLTDNDPMFFVTRQGKREKDREQGLRALWKRGNVQLQLMYSMLWALHCHTGFTEWYWDPKTYMMRVRTRSPEGVFPDPWAKDWHDWEYVNIRVPMSPDDIVRMFPQHRERFPAYLAQTEREVDLNARVGGTFGTGPGNLEMPPGAMQTVPIGRPPQGADYQIVDFLYIKDDSRENVEKKVAGAKAIGILPPPKTIPRYPTGRLIVRTGKMVLFDGRNKYRRFPIAPLYAWPPIYGSWGCPPVQYLIQIQHLAESMMSQNAENQIRMNYGYRLQLGDSINNPEDLDKLAGVIRVNPNVVDDVQKALKIVYPQGFGSEQYAAPGMLIAMLRELAGFGEARSGKMGAGNVSAGLQDASIAQGQSLTRMRSKLLADHVEEVGRGVFEGMVDFMDDSALPMPNGGVLDLAPWQGVPLDQLAGWDVALDASSLRVMGAATLRQLVPVLLNLQAITKRRALEWLGVPNWRDLGDEVEQQDMMRMLQAQAAASGGGGKKKGHL